MTTPQNPSHNPNPNSGNGGGANGSGWQNTPGNAHAVGANPHYGAPQGQPGQAGQAVHQQPPKKKGNTALKVFIGIVVVILLLLVLAEFGARWYIKDQLKTGLQEQQQESGVSSSEDPEVSLGASPMLLGLVQGKIPEITMDTPSTLDITYEDQNKSKPTIKGQPAMHVEMRDMKMDPNNTNESTVGDMKIQTKMPKEMLLAQATESANREGGGGALAELLQVTDVRTNPDNQTLTFELTGGLVTFDIKPTVDNGQLKMQMDGAALFGMQLPDSFTGELESQLEESVPAELQGGLKFESVDVTDDGMDIHLHGTDVKLSELENNTGDSSGGGNGEGAGNGGEPNGSGNSQTTDANRPWKNDGPVGSSALAAAAA